MNRRFSSGRRGVRHGIDRGPDDRGAATAGEILRAQSGSLRGSGDPHDDWCCQSADLRHHRRLPRASARCGVPRTAGQDDGRRPPADVRHRRPSRPAFRDDVVASPGHGRRRTANQWPRRRWSTSSTSCPSTSTNRSSHVSKTRSTRATSRRSIGRQRVIRPRCLPGDGCTVWLAGHRSTHQAVFARLPEITAGTPDRHPFPWPDLHLRGHRRGHRAGIGAAIGDPR